MSCYMSPELLELISLHVDVPDGIAYELVRRLWHFQVAQKMKLRTTCHAKLSACIQVAWIDNAN